MSLLQEALDAYATLTRRVEQLEYDKVAQALEIIKLKKRVKKLQKGNKGRIIDKMDKDDAIALMDDKEEDKKEEKAKEDEPAKVQEVVNVVTTAKLITEVVTAANETVTAASTIISAAKPQVPAATITVALVRVAVASTRRRKKVVIRDPKEESTTIIPVDTKSKDKGKGIMDVAIDHVKLKAKEDPAVQRYQAMKSSYEEKHDYTKEQMEEEESRALQTINETPAQKQLKGGN
nr:hypothetical protein [Tanacetum cinerariifolium]